MQKFSGRNADSNDGCHFESSVFCFGRCLGTLVLLQVAVVVVHCPVPVGDLAIVGIGIRVDILVSLKHEETEVNNLLTLVFHSF